MKYLIFLLLLSAEVFSQPSFPVRYYTKGDSIGVALDFGINWYHKTKVPSEFILKYPLGNPPKESFPTKPKILKSPENSIEFDGKYCYRTVNGKREKIPCATMYTGKDTVKTYYAWLKIKHTHKWVEMHQDTVTHIVDRDYLVDMHDDLQKRIVDYEESIPLVCLICHEEKKKIIHYKKQR
jgi:hypothetical protein